MADESLLGTTAGWVIGDNEHGTCRINHRQRGNYHRKRKEKRSRRPPRTLRLKTIIMKLNDITSAIIGATTKVLKNRVPKLLEADGE